MSFSTWVAPQNPPTKWFQNPQKIAIYLDFETTWWGGFGGPSQFKVVAHQSSIFAQCLVVIRLGVHGRLDEAYDMLRMLGDYDDQKS